jgi:hypothetical protein
MIKGLITRETGYRRRAVPPRLDRLRNKESR